MSSEAFFSTNIIFNLELPMMEILFLCCDMGETNALIPVMHELQNEKIDFKVMTMGAAIQKLKSDDLLKDRVIEVKSVDTAQKRTESLENVAAIIKDMQPILVISGPASKAQEQLLQALTAKKKIVYLDNFNYSTSNPYFETVKGVISAAQKVICVSEIVKEQILAIENSPLKEKNIRILGRPSLETWVKQVQEVDKKSVLEKMNFDDKKNIVTFIGGYGPRYEQGVNEAYDSATKMLKEAGYQVHIQYHPNIKKEQPLTTTEAVAIADCIVCYDSTVGFEALFAGKKVIYLQPKSVEPYDNIAIEKKLADCVQTNEELLEVIYSPSTYKEGDVYEVLGVPRNSTQAITQYVLKKLDKHSN
jgi:hypothetical protein